MLASGSRLGAITLKLEMAEETEPVLETIDEEHGMVG